jgi:putative FmdB family regulatory protein
VPTYQYACTECGEQLEAVQSFTDPALTECPNCSGKLRKVFNSVGIVFKGSGFYRNDSRAGNASKEKETTPSTTTATTESKSDSSSSSAKPAAAASTPAAASSSSSSGSSGAAKTAAAP